MTKNKVMNLLGLKRFWVAFFFAMILACARNPEIIKSDVFSNNKAAEWIQDGRSLPAMDSLFYLDQPAPLFRKRFKLKDEIGEAQLFITAAGYYRAQVNGVSAGEHMLDPAWTDYSKRIYYTEHDVTSLLKAGDNCLAVNLGNGFYNPLPLRKWGRRNPRKDLTVGKPAFIAKLLVTYKNGRKEEFVSDTSWKCALGPLTKNSVYLGVTYDARKEINGWNLPSFEDGRWDFASKGNNPGGLLQKAFFPPTQVTEEIKPLEIYASKPGIWIVDMGVNFTGTYRIKLTGNRDDTISFRFGERIYEDRSLNPMTTVIGQVKKKGLGGPGAPDTAWQTDSYIIGDNQVSWFCPEFTYHTYRYMEVTGLSQKPKIDDIKGLFIHSNVTNQNSFSCSSELLNSIQESTERTFLANLVGVQSDCAAREKFGYGGDLNATSESFIYNFDMQSFYRKTIYDWVDAMNDTGFVDTAPFAGVKYCGLSWESAYLTTQYYLYLYYNDKDIIEELYDRDKAWMQKVARIHPTGMVEQGLSDHESLEPVPVKLTGTCHYLQCARIMKTFAAVMGDTKNESKYQMLAAHLEEIIRAEFWDKPVKEKINRQTLFATLLYHGIVPDQDLEAAKDSLWASVQDGPSGHFITGIFGTKYVLEMLSENISSQKVFDIVNSTIYPGWGHMIDKGATTIWETWKESDNTYSNCHPMFGTVTEWYYRWIGGIRPDPENPGFKSFFLMPSMPDGLESASCSYHSPFGKIASNWKKDKDGYLYEVAIPESSSAKIILPVKPSQNIEIKSKVLETEPFHVKGMKSGKFTLGEGEYMITVSAHSENKN